MDKPQREICGICKSIIPADKKKCGCSDRGIVFFSSNNKFYINEEDRLICECGNDKWNLVTHVNLAKAHLYNYQCSKCKRVIGKESEKSDEYDGW